MGAGENARPHKMVGLENCSDLDLLHQEGLDDVALLDVLEPVSYTHLTLPTKLPV